MVMTKPEMIMANISCIQIKPALADFETNVSRMEGIITNIMAERPGTDLIVFPELITSGYECSRKQFISLSEKMDICSPSLSRISELCKNFNVSITYGLPELGADGEYYNSAVLLGPNGDILGSYRKIHLFDTEKLFFTSGSEIDIIDTSFGKVGLMICWDAAFPELSRAYALQGAQLLIVVSNWESPYSDDWDLITRARAFDNTLYLVSANRIGLDKTLNFFGHSNIISPVGKVIESLNEEVEGIIHAELDLHLTQELREGYYTFFKDRKPHLYTDLATKF